MVWQNNTRSDLLVRVCKGPSQTENHGDCRSSPLHKGLVVIDGGIYDTPNGTMHGSGRAVATPCPAKPHALAALAARLTHAEDRAAYANILAYFDALPPGDEMGQFVHFIGLNALLAEHIPDAVAELLNEIRANTQAMRESRDAMDERLACLPDEIAGCADPNAIGRALAESIRQSAGAELAEVGKVATETTAALRPLRAQYNAVTAQIASQLGRFTEVSLDLSQATAKLAERDRKRGVALLWLGAALLFMVGAGVGYALARM